MTFMNIPPGHELRLPGSGSRPDQIHVFEADMIDALDTALAAQRPLLVKGEPGIGKSQLARAAARQLGRMFIPHVVDARTESTDLLWHYDAVSRLADAQLAGALGEPGKRQRRRLAVRHYLHPGPLWWAFDWDDALSQATSVGTGAPPQDEAVGAELEPEPVRGCVVLIDEIDKAESDVPNGLLEALGNGEFRPLGRADPVVARAGVPPPLVVITTNNERTLPDAFVRRCLVLKLDLPDTTADDLATFLVARGQRHFPEASLDLLQAAAEQLGKDRRAARERRQLPLPGQAEYLDLLRAVTTLERDPGQQVECMRRLARFAFSKHEQSGP